MRPYILGNQGAKCVECEVVRLCFARRRIHAEGVALSVKWAGMKVRDGPAAEPMQLLGAAAVEVMPKKRGVVLVEYLPADAARVHRPGMRSFTGWHPEEGYSSWNDRVTVQVCAGFCAVLVGTFR